jgi:hypothetical protein
MWGGVSRCGDLSGCHLPTPTSPFRRVRFANRTERRAAEGAARKAERTALLAQLAVTEHREPSPPPPQAICQIFPSTQPKPARIAANRINAQMSTGPRTPEGPAVSSVNALKHGLTGNTVLLASDDAQACQQRLDTYVEQYRALTLEERRLVQSPDDADWRLDRILHLESTIYARGRVELADYSPTTSPISLRISARTTLPKPPTSKSQTALPHSSAPCGPLSVSHPTGSYRAFSSCAHDHGF